MPAEPWYLIPLGKPLGGEALRLVRPLLDQATADTPAQISYPPGVAVPIAVHPTVSLRDWRQQLRKIAQAHDIDLALQTHAERHANYRLACFDMDSTLIRQEVMDEIAKDAGIGEQVSTITESAMRGEIDFKESFARRLALLEGFPASRLPQIASRLRFSPGAVELVKTLKSRQLKVAIFSGGFSYFAKHLQSAGLGEVDYIHSNELEIADGKLTGKINNPLVNERRKAALIQEIANELGIGLSQTIAVGDGANDIPMLKLAGLGIAYRAKPLVQENTHYHLNHSPLDTALALFPDQR